MIAAIQKMKSTFAAGLFAALVISTTPVIASAPTTAAASTSTVTSSYSDYVGNAAWFTFFLMCARLWTREGDTSPVRYNLDELAIGENVANNLYYLVDDGIIGHFGKKPYLTVDTDNSRIEVQLADAEDANGKPIKDAHGNKIKVSTACYPKGLMGWASFYIKPIIGAIGVTLFVKELFLTNAAIKAGTVTKVDAKGNTYKVTDFVEAFFARVSSKYSIGKFTDYGTGAFISAVGGVLVGTGLAK